MGKLDFTNEIRVDVTLLREGLNAVRGLCNQILCNEDATKEDYQTLVIQLEELCEKTLWREGEAIDAGFVQSGWMPNGPQDEIEIVSKK